MMALKSGKTKFDQQCYMVRAFNFKKLREGKRKIHDLYINNVWKMQRGQHCFYCGKDDEKLTVDHIFPRSKDGEDTADNVVLACRSCNSSKSNLDLLEWYSKREMGWPLPYIFAYYFKHVYLYAVNHDLLDKTSEAIDAMDLPFKYEYMPLLYPDAYLEDLQEVFNSPSDDPNDYM